jgi:hypothetical protein
MLVHHSKKHQPEFDLETARQIYAGTKWEAETDPGVCLASPHHLFSVETLRERLKLRVGRAVPTDVFVFGKGEPPRPDCTLFGGVPFWPLGRKWPIDGEGKQYQFFAQINFADSKDLIDKLPGDLLLMFIGADNVD